MELHNAGSRVGVAKGRGGVGVQGRSYPYHLSEVYEVA